MELEEKMSLTDVIAEELYTNEPSKTCCRKAFLCGLLYSCRPLPEERMWSSFFYRKRDAENAAKILSAGAHGGSEPSVTPCTRGGHRAYELKFFSKSVCRIFTDADNGKAKELSRAVGFQCRECAEALLRGVFLSCATVGKQKNGYHAELPIRGENRANLLSELLAASVAPAGRVKRGERIGLYYKSNSKIADLLYFIGAPTASFRVTNISIERDIRNNENRATNCVTRNISRSVGAAAKQLEAIKYLYGNGMEDRLSRELAATAELRLEYDSASLCELAAMHEPPLTKSGLNGRLARIIAIADKARQSKLKESEREDQ